MFTFILMFLLLIVAGWLDARLDWRSMDHSQEKTQ